MNMKVSPEVTISKLSLEAKAPDQVKHKLSLTEDSNGHDIIGWLLQGRKKNIKTLVTYNFHTNTYYENYNTTIVSEENVAFGVWESLTPGGAAKIRNLKRFYELKMPERVRELRDSLRMGYTPDQAFLDRNGVYMTDKGGESIGPSVDPDVTLDYDLDNVHVAAPTNIVSAVCKVRADVNFDGDEFDAIHSQMEVALTSVGIKVDQTADNPREKKYLVSYPDSLISNIEGTNLSMIEEFTELLSLCVKSAGWSEMELKFPLENEGYNFSWFAVDPTNSVVFALSLKDATLRFYRTGQ